MKKSGTTAQVGAPSAPKIGFLARLTDRSGGGPARIEGYTDAVVAAVAVTFPDVGRSVVGQVVRTAVARQLRDPVPSFEVIVDHPSAANWRLKSQAEDRARFRVADCRMFGTSRRADVEDLNTRLEQIAAQHLGGRS